jgi:2-dehydro-3-deoxyphosphooctonate aldolase (KDO 8-P synthase)
MKRIQIANFFIGPREPLAIIAGPCMIESEDSCLFAAEQLKTICERLGVPLIFKSSYDKANRTCVHSFRGPGVEKGLRILERVKQELALPVDTDVHTVEEAQMAGEVVDLVQIPAFLCRQTDLVVAAGNTGRVVFVKKGQFMAPWTMKHIVEKIKSTGNDQIILGDRGASFGYGNLVADMRAIPIMQELGYPVAFDATHSVQLPGGAQTGGESKFIAPLARAAVAAGCECVFLETHPNPSKALSDAESQLDFEQFRLLVAQLHQLREVVLQWQASTALSS